MLLKRTIWLAVAVAIGSLTASASGITFVCDTTSSSVDPDTAANGASGTCAYLNNVIAPLYTSTFSNVNANIYVEMGSTSLGENESARSAVTFSQYQSILNSEASTDPIRTSSLAALNTIDQAEYGSGDVVLSSALASSLGFTNIGGIFENGNSINNGSGCTIAANHPNCYNGVITLSNSQPLYFDQNGGSIGSNQYDAYSVIEHETDEVLGTASCIDTTASNNELVNGCSVVSGNNTPAAIDLFRYNAAGSLAANGSYVGLNQAPPGAYFSYNGGVTNGAGNAIFNTVANGDDYADFTNSCQYIQDGIGCPGQVFSIATDGGAELNMLDALGYQETVAPEPTTIVLFGSGIAGILLRRRFRRA